MDMAVDELQEDGRRIAECSADLSRCNVKARVQSTAHFCKYIRANALVCASGESESPCLHETNSERFLTVAITT